MKQSVACVCVSLLASSCGDEPKKLTCAWFEGDNCYKESVAAAVSCTSAETFGTYNMDESICTYTDGVEVRFTSKPDPQSLEGAWDFSIYNNGTECMSFREKGVDGEDGAVLTTSLGTFELSSTGFSMTIDCPDGESGKISASDAFECDWGHLPGYGSSSDSFSLSGAPAIDASMFACQ